MGSDFDEWVFKIAITLMVGCVVVLIFCGVTSCGVSEAKCEKICAPARSTLIRDTNRSVRECWCEVNGELKLKAFF